MAIGHLSYTDLSAEQRAEAANKIRTQLRAQLHNPALTVEQRAQIQERMLHLDHWAAGALPVKAAPKRTPQHHEVGVSEGVPLTEKV